jgi:hypothetical protein
MRIGTFASLELLSRWPFWMGLILTHLLAFSGEVRLVVPLALRPLEHNQSFLTLKNVGHPSLKIRLRCNRAVDELFVVWIGGDNTKLEG